MENHSIEKHIDVLAILHIIFGGLGMLAGFLVLLAAGGAGLLANETGTFALLSLIGTSIMALIAVLSLPQLIGGIFLLRRKSWARIVILIVSFLSLLSIPFGTALGIYGIWVLLAKEESAALFA